MKEWKKYKLGEILTVKYGKDHKKLDAGSIPVYGSGGLMRFVNSYICDSPSILIPRKGSLNNVMYVEHPFWTVDTMFWTIIDTSIAIPRFVYYAICKIDFESLNVGSAVPSMTVPIIEDIEIFLPSLDEQKRIVNVLSSLESKIELNRQINDNLEQQAQALYKSWFVDFEPFEDGEFVESEMGKIPVGWTVVKFSDLTEIPKKTINPQKFPETIFKHYSLPACDNGLIPENQTGKDIMSNKIILQNNTTLFSKLNPRIKRIWFTCEVQPNSICSTEFIPYRATNENESGYIFSIINSEAFYASVMGCVNGATGSHQRFHAEDTNDFLCAYNKEAVNEFSQHIDIILKKMHDLRQENVKLASMRDTLLPKLMSGELKINEIDC